MEYYLLSGLILIILLWYIITYNALNKAMIKIREADAGIDVALSKRYALLTQLVEVVKGYVKYEKEVLLEVIKLRSGMTIDEKNEVNHKMSSNFEKINLLVESYPDLKASENFMHLQEVIVDAEEHLQASRRFYNSNVSIYNQMIATFPTIIIAALSGLKEHKFFEADGVARENVKLDL